MARELDSQMLQRLQENYREMSDGELLRLAAKPDELTETAREVLRGEMAGRKLKLEDAPASPFAAMERDPLPKPEFGTQLAKGMVVLTTFHDAIAAREACDLLETEGMEIEVRDAASAHGGSGSFYGGPPVALQVIVQQRELGRAMAILREKMGMFPLQEVEVADEAIDDGTTAVLGAFGHRSDAEDVARVLEEAGVWHRIAANEEGSVADEDAYTLEVKEVDLVRAGDVVERGLGLPEG